jgi:hypothetical protein
VQFLEAHASCDLPAQHWRRNKAACSLVVVGETTREPSSQNKDLKQESQVIVVSNLCGQGNHSQCERSHVLLGMMKAR